MLSVDDLHEDASTRKHRDYTINLLVVHKCLY